MKVLKGILEFLMYGNMIIASAAVLLCLHTYQSFGLRPPPAFLLLIFFATTGAYSFHAIFKKKGSEDSERMNWIQSRRQLLLLICFVSIPTAIITSLFYKNIIVWLVVLAILTFIYSAPRIIKIFPVLMKQVVYMKTIYLAIIWTFVTCFLPLLEKTATDHHGIYLFSFIRLIFIFQICMLFESRDIRDNSFGIKDLLISRLNDRSIYILFVLLSILVQISVLLLMFDSGYKVFLSIFIPEMSLLLLFRKTVSQVSDRWYYLVIDCHLMFPGIILLLLDSL